MGNHITSNQGLPKVLSLKYRHYVSHNIGTPRTTTPNHTYTDESIIGHYGVTNVLGRLIMMANLDFCGKNYDSKTLHFLTVCN